MPFPLLLVALLFLALPLRAQEKENTVLLTAHLVDGEDDKALLAPWGVNFICDALDQAVVAIPDSTGYVELRLPRGKCVVIPEFYYPVTLNLTADTVVERLELTYDAFNRSNIYRSRHKKDSTLRAEEAALKADLHYVDTSYSFLDPDPNYYLQAQLYEYDLHYPLPRWRTFSRDSALLYLRYSYHQNPERYDYLYYPICQLEHALGLPHDRKVRRPKAPDSRWYAPLPVVKDNWLLDTSTSYMDLYDRARNMSHHLALELAPQGEKSLVYPRRKKPAVRILYSGGLGNSTAIRIEDGLAVVDKRLCIGCGKCVSVCPRKLIELVPASATIHVLCNNPVRGPEVTKVCGVGCIGCHLCEKNAGGKEANHFTFNGFLAKVNY